MLAMTRPRPPRTSVVQLGHAQAMEIRLDLARSIRDARRDSGLTARQLATAAGVGLSTVRELETAGRDPGLEVMARLAAALGGRLRTWMEPGAGPLVHDRYQGAMLGALLAIRHRRWGADTEVLVREPIRGVIDAVLEDELQPPVVAVESESGLRRIEQQVRWANAKADGLAADRIRLGLSGEVSRLLLLRVTSANRRVAATYADILGAAYPARSADAYGSLTGIAPWPGAAIVWCEASGETARLLSDPPRGIVVGR